MDNCKSGTRGPHAHPFNPDWVIAPGETLKEWREDNNLPLSAAAKACGIDRGIFAKIEDGKQRITLHLADRLEYGTQIPARLWMNLERHYREGLKAGKKAM